jgi:hypothetical protein
VGEILNNLKFFFESEVADLEFAILFGSRALSAFPSYADIDFKIFLRSEASDTLRRHVANFAHAINKRFASISEVSSSDVPYAIKTVISKSTLNDALNLKAFVNSDGRLYIPPVSLTPDFLASQDCQLRTVLSALTTPNVLICGDLEAFKESKKRAFDSIKKLVCNVYNVGVNDHDLIVKLLLESPTGAEYKEYLGYKNNSEIKNYLLKHILTWAISYDD